MDQGCPHRACQDGTTAHTGYMGSSLVYAYTYYANRECKLNWERSPSTSAPCTASSATMGNGGRKPAPTSSVRDTLQAVVDVLVLADSFSLLAAVAEQEMLHLALAGNMLRALGGTQLLYDKKFMPEYPSQILFDKIDMELRPADKRNLECFLKVSIVSRRVSSVLTHRCGCSQIEAPYMPPPELEGETMAYASLLPSYESIGEFYKELQHGERTVWFDSRR